MWTSCILFNIKKQKPIIKKSMPKYLDIHTRGKKFEARVLPQAKHHPCLNKTMIQLFKLYSKKAGSGIRPDRPYDCIEKCKH